MGPWRPAFPFPVPKALILAFCWWEWVNSVVPKGVVRMPWSDPWQQVGDSGAAQGTLEANKGEGTVGPHSRRAPR